MNPHFGPGPQTPQPTPDGLARAFSAADRRRLRTALLTAAMPVLVTFAMSAPFGPDGRAGLEPVVPPAVSATASLAPSSSPPASESADPGRSGGAARRPEAPPPSYVTAPPPSAVSGGGERPLPDDDGAIVFAGNGMSVATFTLTQGYVLRFADATHGGAGETYGVYLEKTTRTQKAGVIHLPGQPDAASGWTTFQTLLGNTATLQPGQYRAWVIGTGPTWVKVPIEDGSDGITVRTTRPAATTFRVESSSVRGVAVEERAKLAEPAVPVVGVMLGEASSGPPVSRIVVCLTNPDDSCDATNPDGTAIAYSTDGYAASTAFFIEKGDRRDLVVRQEPTDPNITTTITLTYLLIYL